MSPFRHRLSPGRASTYTYVALSAILVTAFALAMLPTDPRLAIAGAVSLSTLGVAVVISHHDAAAPGTVFVAAAPLALAVTAARTRHLRRPARR